MKKIGLSAILAALLSLCASASTIVYTQALPTANVNSYLDGGAFRSNIAFGESDPFPTDGPFAAMDGDTVTLSASANVSTMTTWMVASQALSWASPATGTLDPLGNQALGLEMSSVSLWFRVDPGLSGSSSWTLLDTGSFDFSFDVASDPNAVGTSNSDISALNMTYSNGQGFEDPNNQGSFFPLWQLSFSGLDLNLAAGVTYDFAVTGLGYYPGGPALPAACANDDSAGEDCMMNPDTGYGYWYNEYSNPGLSGSNQSDSGLDSYLRCSYDDSYDGLPSTQPCLVSDPLTDGNWNKGADMNVELDGTFASSVPEPATIGLFGIGLVGLALVRRKR